MNSTLLRKRFTSRFTGESVHRDWQVSETCVRVRLHIYVYIYAYIYVYIHVYIYVYIHAIYRWLRHVCVSDTVHMRITCGLFISVRQYSQWFAMYSTLFIANHWEYCLTRSHTLHCDHWEYDPTRFIANHCEDYLTIHCESLWRLSHTIHCQEC